MSAVQIRNCKVTVTRVSESRDVASAVVANIQDYKGEVSVPEELSGVSGAALDFSSPARLLIDAPADLEDMPYIFDRVTVISSKGFPAYANTNWIIWDTPRPIPGNGQIGPTVLLSIVREVR